MLPTLLMGVKLNRLLGDKKVSWRRATLLIPGTWFKVLEIQPPCFPLKKPSSLVTGLLNPITFLPSQSDGILSASGDSCESKLKQFEPSLPHFPQPLSPAPPSLQILHSCDTPPQRWQKQRRCSAQGSSCHTPMVITLFTTLTN
jgi:hypothetical protein